MLYRSFIAAVLPCAACQQAGNAAADYDAVTVQQSDPAVVSFVADETVFDEDASLVITAASDVRVRKPVVYQGCMY
ncbi:hypothetical protein [Chitinophaga cymbidii]|uniref:hypothetical protein n=1 Tax=Chitinophaga cymbidii TaxID=1096750 RepID=UPI0011BF3700|nr:hypothetical protein [Chitinophaga cymbidii]